MPKDIIKKNILIAEDDRSFRKGLAYELEDLGYKVVEAQNGKQAIEILNKNQFDLIISDLVMPEADGLEVYQNLQQFQPEAKFILLTVFVDSDRAKTAQSLLKENFLEKSASYDLLFQKIRQLLEKDSR